MCIGHREKGNRASANPTGCSGLPAARHSDPSQLRIAWPLYRCMDQSLDMGHFGKDGLWVGQVLEVLATGGSVLLCPISVHSCSDLWGESPRPPQVKFQTKW